MGSDNQNTYAASSLPPAPSPIPSNPLAAPAPIRRIASARHVPVAQVRVFRGEVSRPRRRRGVSRRRAGRDRGPRHLLLGRSGACRGGVRRRHRGPSRPRVPPLLWLPGLRLLRPLPPAAQGTPRTLVAHLKQRRSRPPRKFVQLLVKLLVRTLVSGSYHRIMCNSLAWVHQKQKLVVSYYLKISCGMTSHVTNLRWPPQSCTVAE